MAKKKTSNRRKTTPTQRSQAARVSTPKTKRTKRRATAHVLAAGQRDISVSEFFAKNRHLLGFDSPRKALLTSVKKRAAIGLIG